MIVLSEITFWNNIMSDTSQTKSRPLSPHLQVYRLPMTALMSISHRFAGIILCGGTVLIAAFLMAAAAGPDWYNLIMGYAATVYGTAFLMAWSFVLYYHLFNGIRHLIWDTVHLLDRDKAVAAGWVVLLATFALTLATWHFAGKI